MKPEMRHALAQLSFEEKIRKVSELIQLSREVKEQRIRQRARIKAKSIELPFEAHESKRERSGR
jgi:ornithine carbamoyltransferase